MKKFRLPFRLKVPERDELIAFGLSTLAVGLMVGMAIGPIVNGSAQVIAMAIPGGAANPATEGETASVAPPALGAPAGSQLLDDSGEDVESTPVSTPVEPASTPVESPESPSEETPYRSDPKPDPDPEPDPDPAPEPEGTLVEGTVLANSPWSKTYWLSSDGAITTVFAGTVPDPGLVVSAYMKPLANGTLAETVSRSAVDLSKETKVKAVVSFVDPAAGVLVLSGRGGSLPVYAATASTLDEVEVGAKVEASLNLNVPDPTNFAGTGEEAAVEELPIQLTKLRALAGSPPIELTGDLVTADQSQGVLSVTADSVGSLGSTVELQTPEGFPFEIVKPGRRYSITATRIDGSLRVVGLSPASGKSAANDPARAFGTHIK